MWATFMLLIGAATAATATPFAEDLVPVVRAKQAPVFQASPAGWDTRLRERGWILKEKNGPYRLWYTGYDGSDKGMRQLGHATSTDGVRWKRHAQRPIFGASWIEDVCVVKDNGLYYLFAENGEHGLVWMTSRDGISWRHRGPVVIATSDGAVPPKSPGATPTVFVDRGVWHLYYQNSGGVWLATAKGPEGFRNVKDRPVLQPGPEGYDRTRVATDQIIAHGGRYYMLYHATGEAKVSDRGWNTSIAVSSDLIRWTKYAGNPIIGDNKSSGLFVHDGAGYRLYTMHDQVELFAPAKRRLKLD